MSLVKEVDVLCIKVPHYYGVLIGPSAWLDNPFSSLGEEVKKIRLVGVTIFVLLTSLLVATANPASATLRVPKNTWPACTDASMTYCVDSVSVTTARGKTIPLQWVASGKQPVAAPTSTSTFAPLISLDNKGVVVDNAWWLDQTYREQLTTPGGTFTDDTKLLGTPGMPQAGAVFDPTTKLYDLNWLPEQYTAPTICTDPATKTTATKPWQDCFKGIAAFSVGNKVINLFPFASAADVPAWIALMSSRTFVDGGSLVATSQQPAMDSIYDPVAKTFSKLEPLVTPQWVLDQALPTAPDAQVADPASIIAPVSEPGRALAGRWTVANWDAYGLGGFGYDGLFVDAKTANEFVNHVLVNVNPTMSDATFKTAIAGQIGNKNYATNLDSDTTINVKLRTGEIKVGVTVAVGTDITVNAVANGNNSTMSISGNPVTVPLAKTAKDCTGEAGIAKANVRQFMSLIVVQNDTSGFGVDGTSGDMYVGSNGVCSLSTPIWNPGTKQFTWTVAAPHFAADGVTQNLGFYKAIIPAADAKLLWGLDNPNDAATALTVAVSTEAGGSSAAISVISVKNGRIIIDTSGFGYSRPKITIGIRANYKKNAITPAKVTPPKSALKKSTLTCVLGKTRKTITAVKPVCPKGFKKA